MTSSRLDRDRVRDGPMTYRGTLARRGGQGLETAGLM